MVDWKIVGGDGMVKGAEIVRLASLQVGKPYVFGVEVDGQAKPKAFDCSELVQWICNHFGITPEMPDGAKFQLKHCEQHGTAINMETAKITPGALVFMRDPGSKEIHHVAISCGPDGTVEARGRNYGVGFWPWRKGFTDAALIPGVQY